MARAADPPLLDPAHDPRRTVGLSVAARYLGVHRATLRARIEAGDLPAWRDGNIYRIRITALVRYARQPPASSS